MRNPRTRFAIQKRMRRQRSKPGYATTSRIGVLVLFLALTLAIACRGKAEQASASPNGHGTSPQAGQTGQSGEGPANKLARKEASVSSFDPEGERTQTDLAKANAARQASAANQRLTFVTDKDGSRLDTLDAQLRRKHVDYDPGRRRPDRFVRCQWICVVGSHPEFRNHRRRGSSGKSRACRRARKPRSN